MIYTTRIYAKCCIRNILCRVRNIYVPFSHFFLETNMKAIKAPRLGLRLTLNIIIQRTNVKLNSCVKCSGTCVLIFFGFVRYNNDRKVWNWSKWHLKIDMILIRTFFFYDELKINSVGNAR